MFFFGKNRICLCFRIFLVDSDWYGIRWSQNLWELRHTQNFSGAVPIRVRIRNNRKLFTVTASVQWYEFRAQIHIFATEQLLKCSWHRHLISTIIIIITVLRTCETLCPSTSCSLYSVWVFSIFEAWLEKCYYQTELWIQSNNKQRTARVTHVDFYNGHMLTNDRIN